MAAAPQARQNQAASPPPTVEVDIIDAKPIPQTPLGERNMGVDQVTVHFLKYTPFNNTAYQQGSFAGFSRPIAQRLINGGNAVLAETPAQRDAYRRDVSARVMLTK